LDTPAVLEPAGETADTDRRTAREAATPAAAAWAPIGAAFMDARARRAAACAALVPVDPVAVERRIVVGSSSVDWLIERLAARRPEEFVEEFVEELAARPPSVAQAASWTRPDDERRSGIPEWAVGDRRTEPAADPEADPAVAVRVPSMATAWAAATEPGEATD